MREVTAKQEDINKAISKFKKVKEDTPEISGFGENNWNVLDAMVEMLIKKDVDVTKICEKYELYKSGEESECENVSDFLTGVITIELLLEDY